MTGDPTLTSPTFPEQLAIDTYKASVTKSLETADRVSDKIVTAAVSIATAFGAVIALVTPEGEPTELAILGPFVLLALAVAAALYAQSIDITAEGTNELAVLQNRVTDAVNKKRFWARAAFVALAMGMAVAGWVLWDSYREPASDAAPTVNVQLAVTADAQKRLTALCGSAVSSPFEGSVASTDALSADVVEIVVASCGTGGATLFIARDEMTAAK